MKINSINTPSVRGIESTPAKKNHTNFSMPEDTFEKSQPTVNEANESYSETDAIDFLFNLFPFGIMTKMFDIFTDIKQEMEMYSYLTLMGMKRTRSTLREARIDKLDKANDILFRGSGIDIDNINKVLNDSGITTFFQLDNFQRQYNANPGVRAAFSGQEIEAVKIYGILNSKTHLAKYGDLMLYLYNRENEKENPDFEKLNTYGTFLDDIGVKDLKSFEDKYSHLKIKFNDFESMADKADAVEYMYKTYDSKISMLDDYLREIPNSSKYKTKKVYENLCGVIDYLYEQNKGQNLGNLGNYIDIAVDEDKLKQSAAKNFGPLFHNFENPEDKIDFYTTLKDCGISIKDINSLSSKSVISDSDNFSYLVNFDSLTGIIQDFKGINRQEAKEIYINFKDAMNALYNETDEDTEAVNNLLKIADRFNIKNSNSLLDFYNQANNSRNKNITSEELKDFVRLFKFSESKTIFEDAKKQNKSVIDLLTVEKQRYELAKDSINEFLKEDTEGYFAGKTAEEIYEEYKNIIGNNYENIPSILRNIIQLEIADSSEYKEKAQIINQFSEFFSDKESLITFISSNKFKLDNSEEDNKFIQNSLSILSDISKNESKKDAQRRISYYAESGFLTKSRKYLTKFLKNFPNQEERIKILNTIADKEISSINSIERFAKKYQDENGNNSNILPFITSLPENINFKEGTQILSGLSKVLDTLNIPITINNNNLLNIDLNYFKQNKKLSSESINKLMSSLTGVSENENFITGLPNTYTTRTRHFSRYRIAEEIVNKMNKSEESYKNLLEELNIDFGSLTVQGQKCSDYIYIKAIENALTDDFINFVNSNDWIQYSSDGNKIPNMGLHARLRLIDRFALSDETGIKDLNNNEVKTKLKDIIKQIYTTQPVSIKGRDRSKRFVINSIVNNQNIETVFSNKGDIVTIVHKNTSSK